MWIYKQIKSITDIGNADVGNRKCPRRTAFRPHDTNGKPCRLQHELVYDSVSHGTATFFTELLDKCQDELKRKAEEEKVRKRQKKEQEHRERVEIYGKSPLFDISFVFTGAFTYPREEMMQLAVDAGAFARTSVTRNTDYLVVGYVDNLPDWAIERKIGKANEIISKGGKIKKISESEYIMLIENANRALSR